MQLKYDALSRRVSLRDIMRELPAGGRELKKGFFITGGVALLAMIFALGAVFSGEKTGFYEIVGTIAAPVVIGGVTAWLLYHTQSVQLRRAVKVRRFAAENGLTFVRQTDGVLYPGVIFDVGSDRLLNDGFRMDVGVGRTLEIANYRYVVGSGKNRRDVWYGYIRIDLTRRLPHLVLDGKSNNFLGSNLPAAFARSQRLQLEGDFNRYFDLYVPAGYERDALYIMTPDIMALLIDDTKKYDLEIVGNQLFIYGADGFALDKKEELERLLNLARRVGAELNEQTDYYSDERVGSRSANIIAEPGRTLKKGTSWVSLVLLAFVLYMLFGDEIGLPVPAQQLVVIVIFIVALVFLVRHIRRRKLG